MSDSESRTIDFTSFLMHRLAESWNRPVSSVYQTLKNANALEEYIIPFYDVLHTLGEEYLVEDITEYVRKRGVAV